MPAETRRPPKSSLAASKASATPWGLSAPKPSAGTASARPGTAGPAGKSGAAGATTSAPHASRTRTTASATSSAQARPAKRAPTTIASTQARSLGERRFTMGLLAGAVGLTLALAGVGVRVTVVSSGSMKRMDGTLGRASLEQMEFRAANQRFALWDELAERGATLPDELEVIATNASSSHWFLKVRDRRSGIACSRVGQLLDAPGQPVAPVCDRTTR